MALDIRTRKNLKALGHKLNPVVMVAGKGLSDTVLEEVRRALHDHELIKVKLAMVLTEPQSSRSLQKCVLHL
jgi:RNA-binding protein